MKLNARQLEIFRSVLMIGSATKAATALGISQPAVSRALGDLEQSLGFKLFERRNGRLTATQDGALFYNEIEQHFMTLEAIERVGSSIEALRAGQLRIAAMQAFANGVVPMAIATFAQRYPNVPVVLDGRPRSWVVERVAAGEVDVGIGSLPVDDAAVVTTVIGTLPAVAVLPANHPAARLDVVRPRDLMHDTFITFPRTSQFRLGLDEIFEQAGVTRHRMIEVHSSEAVSVLVGQGAGVSVTMPFMLHMAQDSNIRSVPFEPALEVSLAVLLPIGRTPSRPAAAFIELMKETVARLWPNTPV